MENCVLCNTVLSVKERDLVELDWLEKELIRVEGTVCKKCGATYVVNVTDSKLRASLFHQRTLYNEIRQLQFALNKHRKAAEGTSGKLPKKVVQMYEAKLQKAKEEYRQCVIQNQRRNNALIKWYSERS